MHSSTVDPQTHACTEYKFDSREHKYICACLHTTLYTCMQVNKHSIIQLPYKKQTARPLYLYLEEMGCNCLLNKIKQTNSMHGMQLPFMGLD